MKRGMRRVPRHAAGSLGITWGIALAGSMVAVAHADTPKLTITVHAPNRAYHNVPVTVALPPKARNVAQIGGYTVLKAKDGSWLRCQIYGEGRQTYLTFILPDLPKGEKRVYELGQIMFIRAPEGQVKVAPVKGDLEVHFDSALFTRYTTHSGPNKPFFYPILTPKGGSFTRHYPMEQIAGETHDHPHHRGLWFTHGKVNGIDFWSEEKGAGKTVNTDFGDLISGWVYGGFRAKTDWKTLEDKRIATDTRVVRIYPLPNGDRLLDFEITVRPDAAPLVFGDTKEGMFGLRLPDTLAPAKKLGGHAINAEGIKDADVWAKKSTWVDYWGTIDNDTWGVAIFDNTRNLRHPQTWHARDYGLFTINPFGLHDFHMGPEGAGDYTIPANGEMTLRYRVLFHHGDTATAGVAEQYAAYADPPEVKVR